jgi:eukaryotic-like serine/threonine-protein kinase
MESGRWRQIEEIYHEALARQSDERSAFVREACKGDEELCREIQALLSAGEAPLSLLDHPPFREPSELQLAGGALFGGYRIEELLGKGGMGGVYRARDLKLGREVALKVVADTVAGDRDYLRRFEEEARLASSLNHPNIVTIYGFGEDRGMPYLAMELVRGQTLATILSERRLSVQECLDLGLQLVDALATAHQSGIVHRDLKPANIMVSPEGRLKVLDFGLAQRYRPEASLALAGEDTRTRTLLTAAGVILGTVGYMSPEQATGGQAGPAADQFSFGTILYEMLTGQRAFRHPTAVETLAAIIKEEPAPIQQMNPQVDDPLRRVVERCLAKKPEGRFASTSELASALRELQETSKLRSVAGVASREPAVVLRKLVSRRTAVAMVVVGAAGVAARVWWPAESGVRSLAVLPFENTSNDADAEYLCDGLTDSLIRQIAAIENLLVRPRNATLPFKNKSVDQQVVGRQLRVDAVVSGSVVRRGGKLSVRADLVNVRSGTVLWSKRYDRDEADLMRLQDEIASAIVDEGIRLKLSTAERGRLTRHATEDVQANEYYMRALGHHDRETEDDYLKARQLLLQAVDRDKKFALAYSALAANYTVMAVDGYTKPAESWPLVRSYAQQALSLEPTLREAHGELGAEAFWNQWNWTLAEREYKAGYPLRNVGTGMGYALEEWAMGRVEGALRLIREARAADPVSLVWRLKEADMLHQAGKEQNAAEMYQAVINDQAGDSRAYFGLAEVLAAQGKFDEAIGRMREAYKVSGVDDPDLVREFAGAAGEKGYREMQTLDARAELDRLAARAASNLYASPFDFGRAHARLGHVEEAFGYMEGAFADHSAGLVFLKVDHAWDALRSDPRFQAALRRVGLP